MEEVPWYRQPALTVSVVAVLISVLALIQSTNAAHSSQQLADQQLAIAIGAVQPAFSFERTSGYRDPPELDSEGRMAGGASPYTVLWTGDATNVSMTGRTWLFVIQASGDEPDTKVYIPTPVEWASPAIKGDNLFSVVEAAQSGTMFCADLAALAGWVSAPPDTTIGLVTTFRIDYRDKSQTDRTQWFVGEGGVLALHIFLERAEVYGDLIRLAGESEGMVNSGIIYDFTDLYGRLYSDDLDTWADIAPLADAARDYMRLAQLPVSGGGYPSLHIRAGVTWNSIDGVVLEGMCPRPFGEPANG